MRVRYNDDKMHQASVRLLAHPASRCQNGSYFIAVVSSFFLLFSRCLGNVRGHLKDLNQICTHIFTYDCYLKNLVQSPTGVYPSRAGGGKKTVFFGNRRRHRQQQQQQYAVCKARCGSSIVQQNTQTACTQPETINRTIDAPDTVVGLRVLLQQICIIHCMVLQGLTSHSTHYRSFRRRFYRSDDPTNRQSPQLRCCLLEGRGASFTVLHLWWTQFHNTCSTSSMLGISDNPIFLRTEWIFFSSLPCSRTTTFFLRLTEPCTSATHTHTHTNKCTHRYNGCT